MELIENPEGAWKRPTGLSEAGGTDLRQTFAAYLAAYARFDEDCTYFTSYDHVTQWLTRRPHPGHRHVDRARRLSTRDELRPGTVSRKRARARRKLTRNGRVPAKRGRVHHQPGRVAFGVPLHAPR